LAIILITIQSQNTSSLSFEVSGVVKELKIVASQKVKKGDIYWQY